MGECSVDVTAEAKQRTDSELVTKYNRRNNYVR